MKNITLWTKILANRIAADAEAEAKTARFAADAEAARIAMEAEAEAVAARRITAEAASVHRSVVQSPECKQVEREQFKFWVRAIMNQSITYLKGKRVNEYPPPQALPT